MKKIQQIPGKENRKVVLCTVTLSLGLDVVTVGLAFLASCSPSELGVLFLHLTGA